MNLLLDLIIFTISRKKNLKKIIRKPLLCCKSYDIKEEWIGVGPLKIIENLKCNSKLTLKTFKHALNKVEITH